MLIKSQEHVLSHLVAILVISGIYCNVWKLTPLSDDPCPAQQCITLSQIATNLSFFQYDDTTVVLTFQAGNHILYSEIRIEHLLSLKLNVSNLSEATSITCKQSSLIHLNGISMVHINNLHFISCGGIRAEAIGHLLIRYTVFSGQGSQGTALELDAVEGIIEGSMFLFNVVGNLKPVIVEKWMREIVQTSSAGGAVIVAQSNITIIGSWFKSNSAEVGGAIFCELESSVNIINSTFLWNHATSLKSYPCYGGALFSQGGCKVMFKNCTFKHNFGCSLNDAGGGGAIAAFNATKIKIIDSEFSNSEAVFGGAIIVWKATLRVKRSTFWTNTAVSRGGAICAWYSSVNVSKCRFNGNKAHSTGGALATHDASIDINWSEFNNNEANIYGGGILATFGHVIMSMSAFVNNKVSIGGGAINAKECVVLNITKTEFRRNKANSGGAVSTLNSYVVNIDDSEFFDSHVEGHGGAISIWSKNVVVINMNIFVNNEANAGGGAIAIDYGQKINISWNEFTNSTAHFDGGAIYARKFNAMYITMNRFVNNIAHFDGGAIKVQQNTTYITEINICNNMFSSNRANQNGGAISLVSDSVSSFVTTLATLRGQLFVNNEAVTGNGGAIHVQKITMSSTECWFSENKAETGILYLSQSSAFFSDYIAFCNNTAAPVLLFSSNLTVMEHSHIKVQLNNLLQQSSTEKTSLQQGGAITAIQSNIVVHGTCILVDNMAENGGAIHATESNILVYGEVMIANNTAIDSGGGVHLYQSEFKCKVNSILNITNNTASRKGGGVHAISSLIISETKRHSVSLVLLSGNKAKQGGGVCLEISSKIYILRLQYRVRGMLNEWNHRTFILFANVADYGGAVYVSDNTNFATCASTSYRLYSTLTECFIQVLALYDELRTPLILDNVNFTNNYATQSGSTLFGGLLDRCTVSPHAEVYNNYNRNFQQKPDIISGITYMKTISTINDLDTVSSDPIQLCFCRDNLPNCTIQRKFVRAKKGKVFTISLVAIDQVNHTVNATIRSSLSSTLGGLGEDQSSQTITDSCSNVKFSVFSPLNMSETLILYAEGPCKDAKLSQSEVDITFLPCTCPVGFQENKAEETKCICECDYLLSEIITECYEQNKTLVREGTFWITYLNTTSIDKSSGYSYLVYPYCPLDYCHPPTTKVYIDLNKQNGADEQCNYNRSGILCGRCSSGYSLSLGTSHCVPCPNYWPASCILIIIAALLAGIVVVVILLMLNLTVATGTINGIIFYANIVNANSSTFFPFTEPNFITVFISWLNLEIGIDLCFFEGLDMYWKTLLQLAFPIYVILLVVLIIIISERSTKFARLIGRKNPVATLATLVLFSYTKLIQTIIAGLSFSVLEYSNFNTFREVVWLPDGNVHYLRGKHVVLFLLSLGILIAGIIYTILLFSWQWLIYYKHKKFLKWVRCNKLYLFLEPYHAPYNFKHRYWTGLLLVVRVLLYLASALNVSGAPGINLLVTGIVLIALFLLKAQIQGVVNSIYRKLAVDILETACYVNIILFSFASLYVLEAKGEQKVLAYTSGTVTLVLFLMVILYHTCFEMLPLKKLWNKLNQQRERHTHAISLMDYHSADNILRKRMNSATVTWIDAPLHEEKPLSVQIED